MESGTRYGVRNCGRNCMSLNGPEKMFMLSGGLRKIFSTTRFWVRNNIVACMEMYGT